MKTEDSKFVDYVGKHIDRLEDERCSDTIRKSRRKVDNTRQEIQTMAIGARFQLGPGSGSV